MEEGFRIMPFIRIVSALKAKLNIVSGFHDFLTEDEYLVKLASRNNCELTGYTENLPIGKNCISFPGKLKKSNVRK